MLVIRKFMKNIIITVVTIVIASVVAAFVAFMCVKSKTPTIYVADYAQIQKNYWKFKELNDEVQRMKEHGDAEVAKLNDKLAEIEKSAQAIRDKFAGAATNEERGRIETEEFAPLAQLFQNQQGERNRFTNDANQRIQALIQSKGEEIRLDIFKAVQLVAADKGATYILEKGSIFYGDIRRDISETVITRVNINAPTTSLPSAAPLPTPVPAPVVEPAAAAPAPALTPVIVAPAPVVTPTLEAAPAATPAIEAAPAATPAAEAAE